MTLLKQRLCVTWCIVAGAAIGVLLPGCNIVGPAAYLIEGPGTIDPLYVLEDRPTVVFVDDRRNIMQRTAHRRDLADQVAEDLMVHAKITPQNMIRPTDAIALARAHDSHEKPLPIDSLGRQLGAAQVVYVEVAAFQAVLDDSTPSPFGSCTVRVIDVENRERLFPSEGDNDVTRPFHQVNTRLPARTDSGGVQTTAARLAMYSALARTMGNDVAKVFYKHERIDLGGNLNPR